MTSPAILPAGARQLALDLARPTSYARDDFVVSACNSAAVGALDAWPHWPGGKLALIGPTGAGKTHLARVWAASAGAIEAHHSGAGSAGAILLEDADRTADEDLLFHLLNAADAGATLLLTGRTAPALWPSRLPDLRSRLNALTVAQIDPPDDKVLLGLMDKLFSERNIKPSAEVAAYILSRIERSAPAIQEVVRLVDEESGAEKREVTRILAVEILRKHPECSIECSDTLRPMVP
jgi:chromosomal replication initiation ATPase DnaA